MSAGQVGSRFRDVSDSTGRSYRRVVTRLIFTSIGLQRQPDPTGLGSGLSIVKPDSTGFKYYQTRLELDQHCNVQTL